MRISDWSSDVCSSDLYRDGEDHCKCTEQYRPTKTLKKKTGPSLASRVKSVTFKKALIQNIKIPTGNKVMFSVLLITMPNAFSTACRFCHSSIACVKAV